MTVSSEAFSVTKSESNKAPLGCGRAGHSEHVSALKKSARILCCNHISMDQNLRGMLTKSWTQRTEAVLRAKRGLLRIFYNVPSNVLSG